MLNALTRLAHTRANVPRVRLEIHRPEFVQVSRLGQIIKNNLLFNLVIIVFNQSSLDFTEK